MRVSSVLSLLCGTATVVQGAISSISLPSTIGYNDREVKISVWNSIDQGGGPELGMLYGYDFTNGTEVSWDAFGYYYGNNNLSEARVGFGSNLTLPVPTYFTTPQTGLFKFFIFGLFGVTNEFGVGVWTAEVNYGPTTSNTTVNAKAVGEFEYVNF